MIKVINKIGLIIIIIFFMLVISFPIRSFAEDAATSNIDSTVIEREQKETEPTNIELEKSNIKKVEVSDIEINEYEKTLEVGESADLSATVIPNDATDANISYLSSNSDIVSISSSGKVKGITAGTANIYVKAGNITKTVIVKVNVKAKSIKLDKSYFILKQGQYATISATTVPLNATDTNIIFKSLSPEVASVSSDGTIYAISCGSASIIISNSDISTVATVIVNVNTYKEDVSGGSENITNNKDKTNIIDNSVFLISDCPVIKSSILRDLYSEKKTIKIKSELYALTVDGNKIVNTNNELTTDISLSISDDKIEFVLNNGNSLCGDIGIEFPEDLLEGKHYLYLYNEAKNKYENLEYDNGNSLILNTPGKYCITCKEISDKTTYISVGLILSAIAISLIIIYIALNKRYWFW